jgi:pilus assembly protein CpaF
MELTEEKLTSSLQTNEYIKMKFKIYDQLLDILDLSLIDSLDKPELKLQIRDLTERIMLQEEFSLPLNLEEKERFHQEIQDEVLGLGPIEPFMRDPTVSDILVNTYKQIFVEKFGKLEPTDARFKDDAHLMNIIDKIVSAVGRRIDETCPMVDARLADGSRVNAIIPPIAIDGPSLSIRRFTTERLELEDLINLKTLIPEVGELLRGIVKVALNVLISGGTGSGKTTLLNILSRFVPESERNIEGKGQITARDLVRNSLRMRPDRIIVGEVRGAEVIDMLQAMNTGHDGSLTTIHANSPRDALIRVETLMSMSGVNIPHEAARRYISSALDVIIQSERLFDGSRKIVSLQEVTGMEGDVITMQEIFSFEQTGIDENGKVKGRFKMTGIIPKFMDKFEAYGIPIPYDIFEKSFEI